MLFLNCFDTVRKSIWSVKKLSDEVLAWLCLDLGTNDFKALYKCCIIIMVALWNRADHYIFMLWFVLSSSSVCLSVLGWVRKEGHLWITGPGFHRPGHPLVNQGCISSR